MSRSRRLLPFALPLIFLAAATGLAGYLREAVFAALFGRSALADSFYLGFGIVQTICDLIFVSTLTASIVPLLSGDATDLATRHRQGSVLASAGAVVILGGLLIAIALWFGMNFVVEVVGSGLPPDRRAYVVTFARDLVWLIPLNGSVTLLSLALTGRRHFISAAVPHLGTHVLFAAVLLLTRYPLAEPTLVAATYAGPFAALIWLSAYLRSTSTPGDPPRPTWVGLAALARLSWPTLVTLGLGGFMGMLMTAQIMLRGVAAGYGEGAVAAVAYAFRIYQVPISILVNPAIGVIVATVAAKRKCDIESISSYLKQVILTGAALLAPIAIIAYFGADLIVRVLFHRGQFDQQAVHMTAMALRGFAPCIVAEAGLAVLLRTYQALQMPVVASAGSLGVVAILAALLYSSAPDSVFELTFMFSTACVIVCAIYGSLLFRLLTQLGRQSPPRNEKRN